MSAELKVVAYGYENTRPTGERHALMMVKLDNTSDQYPELAAPLVRLSDAQSALQAQAEDHAAEIRRIRDIRNENAEEYRTEIRLCREEIAALKLQLAAGPLYSTRLKAARYDWLKEKAKRSGRDGGWVGYYELPLIHAWDDTPYSKSLNKAYHHESLDAAIDSARAAVATQEAK